MAAFPISPKSRKRALLVVGPPRSGTSVVAHVLNALGCHFGDPERFVSAEIHQFNPIFFELESLNSLNDRILHHQQQVYADFDWLPDGDFSPQDLATYRLWIEEFLDREFGAATLIGLKDPRFCFTLPIWDEALSRLGYAISYVATDRRAASVVRSNQANNRLSAPANHRLYAHSKLSMERSLRGQPSVARVRYEQLLAEPAAAVEALCGRLDLNPERIQAAVAVIEQRHEHHGDVEAASFDAFIQAADRREFIELEQAFEIYRAILAAHQLEQSAADEDRAAVLEEARNQRERQQRQYDLLLTKLASRDVTIAQLEKQLAEAGETHNQLDAELSAERAELARLRHEFSVLQNSTSRLLGRLRQLLGDRLRRHIGLRTAAHSPQPTDLPGVLFHIDAPQERFVRFRPDHAIARGWAVDTATGGLPPIRLTVGGRTHAPVVVERGDVQQALSGIATVQSAVGFVFCDNPRRGLQRLRLEIQGRDGRWITVKQAWTWRGLKLISDKYLPKRKPPTEVDHDTLIRRRDRHLRRQRQEIAGHIAALTIRPRIAVVIDATRSPAGLSATLDALNRQWLPIEQTVVIAGNPKPAATGRRTLRFPCQTVTACQPAEIDCDFLIVLEAGEQLSADACYQFASSINRDPTIDVLYSDEDLRQQNGRFTQPFRKPDWSPDYLETFDYPGAVFCRPELLDATTRFTSRYDLTLRVTEKTARVAHVPEVLCHRDGRFLSSRDESVASDSDRDALQARLERTGRLGSRATRHPQHAGCLVIEPQAGSQPTVSVVIPTAGKVIDTDSYGRLDLIVRIVEQLRTTTDYPDLEIIVVDNGDLTATQRAALDHAGVKRVTYAEPVFNVAKKLNLGAAIAGGELLLLLNDDIIVEQPDWLTRLAAHFDKPHVGVVGLRLCYPDRTTQHVGVVHNQGNPDHVRRLVPHDEAGYFFSTCGVRNFMAVTGAAMITRADTYARVGGYSEDLAVSYNDADFCMKVRELGLSVVYDGTAELIHLESQSRVASADPAEVRIYHERWASRVVSDPFYNELRLTVASPTFEPRCNRREV